MRILIAEDEVEIARALKVLLEKNKCAVEIWEQDGTAGMDVVWTYIGFLRKKLKQLGATVEIKTVRGAGYSLEEIIC